MIKKITTIWNLKNKEEKKQWLFFLFFFVSIFIGFAHFPLKALRTDLSENVAAKRSQMEAYKKQIQEIKRLRSNPPQKGPAQNAKDVIQGQIDSAQLSGSLSSLVSLSPGSAKVIFRSVSFRDWINLAELLHKQGLKVDSCLVESLQTVGLVSVTATISATSSKI